MPYHGSEHLLFRWTVLSSVIQVRMDQGPKLNVPWGPDNQKTKHFYLFFLQIQEAGGLSIQYQLAPASTSQHWPSEASSLLDFQKNKNALSSGYQELMGHLILIHSEMYYTSA